MSRSAAQAGLDATPTARRTRVRPRAGPPTVRLERLPELDGLGAMDLADKVRDRPGLVLLETARPGRRDRWSYLAVDPVAIAECPPGGPPPGVDPFAEARALLARLEPDVAPRFDDALVPLGGARSTAEVVPPPFVGGLVGYLGYDLGGAFERIPIRTADDQGLPSLRLALHDRVVACDRRTGRAWIGGRAVDGDHVSLRRRIDDLRGALVGAVALGARVPADDNPSVEPLRFSSSLERSAYLERVEAVRAAIARGEIYQANLARRLDATFAGDPWPLYRRLRTGDPALLAAYLDLGKGPDGGRRAILSASPEPFLAVDADGIVSTDPIKGTRPRGRTREEDRALARELLGSAKDRAENVMIVDVLRNDLGRVCAAGTVRVPRLWRLERTATVQHLVSTVTGRLAPGRDPFDLLAAAFPGGSITGAPKLRAMEILEQLEPVRRGPYTGALGWFGPDGAARMSILIRTFVADGRRLTLHVGGGITWRSDPMAEWEETVAKARGPLGAIGATEVG